MKSPKKPAKTAQEAAIETRQTLALDKSIEEEEERFKALRRGMLGSASLLSGASKTAAGAATSRVSAPSAGSGRPGSLLGGSAGNSMMNRK